MMGFYHDWDFDMNWRSLAKQREFQKVYGNGVKRVGCLVVVYLLTAKDFGSAVVASRKVGGAVQRNRAKRLLREARRNGRLGSEAEIAGIFERFFPASKGDTSPANPSGDGETGLWVVLVARHRILSATALEVRDELDTLLIDG